jgi:hypothetical protein
MALVTSPSSSALTIGVPAPKRDRVGVLLNRLKCLLTPGPYLGGGRGELISVRARLRDELLPLLARNDRPWTGGTLQELADEVRFPLLYRVDDEAEDVDRPPIIERG